LADKRVVRVKVQRSNKRGWSQQYTVVLGEAVILSFQRFARPISGVIGRAPSSLGALPVAVGPGGVFLVPVADGEAVWLGLESAAEGEFARVTIMARLSSGRDVNAISGKPWMGRSEPSRSVPPAQFVEGIPRADEQLAVFARPWDSAPGSGCDALLMIVTSRQQRDLRYRFELVDYGRFTTISGLEPPQPMDPGNGYQGWLLP
jgi:hypothetical protein